MSWMFCVALLVTNAHLGWMAYRVINLESEVRKLVRHSHSHPMIQPGIKIGRRVYIPPFDSEVRD